MTITMSQVRAKLDVDEPDYSAISNALGVDAIPYLQKLVEEANPLLASKAAYLASLIGSADAVKVVETASRHPDPTVRVASATGAKNLSVAAASQCLETLLDDVDIGVQKAALQAVGTGTGDMVRASVEHLVRGNTDPNIRRLGYDALDRITSSDMASYPSRLQGDDNEVGFGGGDLGDGEFEESDTAVSVRIYENADGLGGGDLEDSSLNAEVGAGGGDFRSAVIVGTNGGGGGDLGSTSSADISNFDGLGVGGGG